MPIKVIKNLPAITKLAQENISLWILSGRKSTDPTFANFASQFDAY